MRTKTIALAAGAVAATAIAGTLAATLLAPADALSGALAACQDGQVAGGELGGPFTLVNGAGETVTDAEVFDRPSLLYFGYTFCPDVCPLDMARNGDAVALLAERGVDARLVFVTVDPARDTPEVVGDFAGAFADGAVGLTGSEAQVDAAKDAWRAYGEPEAGGDPEYYLVAHSTQTYLVMPGVGFVDFVNREATAEEVADRLACFAAAA